MPNTETTTREVEAIKAGWRGLREAVADQINSTSIPNIEFANGRIQAFADLLEILTGRSREDVIATAIRKAQERGLLNG